MTAILTNFILALLNAWAIKSHVDSIKEYIFRGEKDSWQYKITRVLLFASIFLTLFCFLHGSVLLIAYIF